MHSSHMTYNDWYHKMLNYLENMLCNLLLLSNNMKSCMG